MAGAGGFGATRVGAGGGTGLVINPSADLVSWVDVAAGRRRLPTIQIDESIYPDDRGVQFLIDGRPITTLAGHVNLSVPLRPSSDRIALAP